MVMPLVLRRWIKANNVRTSSRSSGAVLYSRFAAGSRYGTEALLSLRGIRQAGGHESLKQRVRRVRFRQELRMELAGDKPGMILDLDHLTQTAVGTSAADDKAMVFQQ